MTTFDYAYKQFCYSISKDGDDTILNVYGRTSSSYTEIVYCESADRASQYMPSLEDIIEDFSDEDPTSFTKIILSGNLGYYIKGDRDSELDIWAWLPSFTGFTKVHSIDATKLKIYGAWSTSAPSKCDWSNDELIIQTKDNDNFSFKGMANLKTLSLNVDYTYLLQSHCFDGCQSLPYFEEKGIWAYSNDCSYAFYNCYSLERYDEKEKNSEKIYYDSLTLEKCSGIYNTQYMFGNCRSLEKWIFPIIKYEYPTSPNYPHMGMFSECSKLTNIQLSDTIRLYDPVSIFRNCIELSTIYIGYASEDTKNIIPIYHVTKELECAFMFSNCKSLKTLTLNFDSTDCPLDGRYMFSGCASLASLNFSNGFPVITDATYMFSSCAALPASFLTDSFSVKVTDSAKYMFKDCTSLTSIGNYGSTGASSAHCEGMFEGCIGLTSVELYENKVSRYAHNMFAKCTNLLTAYLWGAYTDTVSICPDSSNLTCVGYSYSNDINKLPKNAIPTNLNAQLKFTVRGGIGNSVFKSWIADQYINSNINTYWYRDSTNSTIEVYDISSQQNDLFDSTINGQITFVPFKNKFSIDFQSLSRDKENNINIYCKIAPVNNTVTLCAQSNLSNIKYTKSYTVSADYLTNPLEITANEFLDDSNKINDSQIITLTASIVENGTTYAYSKSFNLPSAHCLMKLKSDGNLMIRSSRITVCPIGMIVPYAGSSESTVPDGWLLCKGQTLKVADYPDLYAVIGTTYGGNAEISSYGATITAATAFNIPNLCGRTIIGSSSSYPCGDTGGEAKHTLSITEMPAHNHTTGTRVNWYDTTGAGVSATYVNSTNLCVDRSTNYTGTTGSGFAHNNMQPYMALNYIICAY